MRVIFDGEGFSRDERAEFDEVLQRIAASAGAGCWRERPDAIRVRGRLTDGRSACEVLELVVQTGNLEAPMVAKVGPMHELEGEWTAFTSVGRNAGVSLQAPSAGWWRRTTPHGTPGRGRRWR